MTIAQIIAYREYWRKSPPAHLLVAAYMKYEPPAMRSAETIAVADLPDMEE